VEKKFVRHAAGYALLDHTINEDILEALKVEPRTVTAQSV
jgi:hypothetical protein